MNDSCSLKYAVFAAALSVAVLCGHADAQGSSGALVIVSHGKTKAVIVVSASAGPEEKRAAGDLRKYVGLMTGAEPAVANTPGAIADALKSGGPVLIVGREALKARPALGKALEKVIDKSVILRRDAIVLQRHKNRVYLVGNNDRSHYFAAAELLRRWGCRWYMPTEFGQCIPEGVKTLTIDELDSVYSPPFEIRSYWISWIGDSSGMKEFQLRNMMTGRADLPPTGHAIGKYIKSLGKSAFKVPLTDPKTADHIAGKVEKMYSAGKNFSLGMEDGNYDSAYPKDQKLMKLQWDKYMMRWSVSDPFLELYNNIAKRLERKYPNSKAKIGFLAYANMTIPPVRKMKAAGALFCELAPIDIDPIHGMDDIQSPPRREYKGFMYKWAKIMDRRLAIYDYDQGMLVWRDIPNPSHHSFAQDVKHYQKAGILGVNTESRNAIATTFTNLYMRSRLLWNPDEDTGALLDDFYKRFYGPASGPMSVYWNTIYKAWAETICTEHEYFVAPAIYTPDVLKVMKAQLLQAEKIVASLEDKTGRNNALYKQRMIFTRRSYEITAGYLGMVQAACTDIDYAKAIKLGQRALAVREELTDTSGIFTTYRKYKVEHRGYAWFPGEVKQYRELLPFVNGEKGKLLARLPLEWAFRRDPENVGLGKNYASAAIDLGYWNANKDKLTLDNRKDYPVTEWEMLNTNLYIQALGIRHPDRQSYTGHGWYRTDYKLTADKADKKIHLRFPGLFNECWLYVNGKEVARRKQGKLWWLNDYRFEWDVDLSGKLKAGKNTIALRINCEHHMGGMFRRPFLYTQNE